MVSNNITLQPRPAASFERANQVVVTADKRTFYLGFDIPCTSPKTSHIPIIWRDNLLFHLVSVFYRIVARTVRFADALQPGTSRQVPQVAGSTDAIPRFANPVLHRFVYSCATYQHVDVWSATTLEFEEPQQTHTRNLPAQSFAKRVQVSLDILAIVGELTGIGQC